MIRRFLPALALLAPLSTACSKAPPEQTVSVTTIPGHGSLAEDNTTKEGPRLMLAEAYMRPTMAWVLRVAAIVAAIEFVSAVLFVRVQARAARAAGEARPPAARTEA